MSIPPDGRAAVTRRHALAAVAVCVLVGAVLAAGVVTSFGPLLRVDAAVSSALYAGDGRARWLDVLLTVITSPGLFLVRALLLVPALVWLVLRRAWWAGTWAAVAVLGISPLTGGLKELVGRARPDFAEGGARYTSLGFPSGHSSGIAASVAVALVLAWPLLRRGARRWWLAVGIVVVVVVGCSRMWLGVHYLSDVLAGWSLGLAWALALAVGFDVLPGGRAALRRGEPAVPEPVA